MATYKHASRQVYNIPKYVVFRRIDLEVGKKLRFRDRAYFLVFVKLIPIF